MKLDKSNEPMTQSADENLAIQGLKIVPLEVPEMANKMNAG